MKRMRRRAGLFLAVFGVVLLLAALSVGLSGYLAAAATAGARAGLAALTGSDGGFGVTIPLASRAAAQDARVRAVIAEVLREDGGPVPVEVTRHVETLGPAGMTDAAGASVRAALASVPDLPAHATLVSGAWPRSAAEASIQADAATRLDVRVGEVLTLPGGAAVTITGTWRVRAAGDPRWLGSSIAITGAADNTVPGWVVIDPSLWAGVESAPAATRADASARWTVRPVASRVTASQLPPLQRASDEVPDLLLRRDPGSQVQEAGGLQSALIPIERNVASASAAATAPLVVVAVLGLVMLLELARMLEQLRREENALVRARGAGRARFAIGTGAEATVAALPGAAVGSAIAAGLLALRGAAGDIPAFGWIGAAVAALVAIAALAGAAGHASRDLSRGSPMRGSGGAVGLAALSAGLGSGRVRSTLGIGAVALLVLAAVISVSQFVLYGSPLVPTASGGVAIDPLAVSAPALAIAAIGLLATAAFPLVARGLERGARRRDDLRSLPLRQLARRSRAALTPILVMAFAVSGLVVGASYAGTWAVSVSQTRAAQIGTPLRVVAPGALDPTIVRPVVGQRAAAPGGTTLVQVGESNGTLVELPASRLTDVVTPVAGAVDPAALATRLRDSFDRPVVPAAASGISVRFTATPAVTVPTAVEVTVVDAAGAESVLRGKLVPPAAVGSAATADPAADPTAAGTESFIATLPSGSAPWTIHAVEVVLPALPVDARVSFSLSAAGGSTAPLPLDDSWVPSRTSEQDGGIVALGGRPGLQAAQVSEGARVLFQSVPGGLLSVPVVISGGLARDSGLSVGAVADMTLLTGGGQLPITVVGVSPVIPGTPSGDGVLADLATVQDVAYREGLRPISATEWWVSTDRPESAAAQVERRAPVGTVVMTQSTPPADQVLESARTAIWIAGAATALLAVLALMAGLLAELRARREEVDVLRALGVPPREQARDRAIEWAVLLALGVLVGLADGFLVCGILVPGLARMAVPNAIDALRTGFHVDLLGGLVELVVLAAALAALLAVVVVTVRRQAAVASASTAVSEQGVDAR
jgi:hypothetical protein